MPRVNSLVNNQEKKIIAEKMATIQKYMFLRDCSKRQLMDKLGIKSQNTMNARMKDGKWNAMQSATINVVLRIPREEWV